MLPEYRDKEWTFYPERGAPSVDPPFVAGVSGRRNSHELGWLLPKVTVSQRLGSPENTAQVHPGQFTTAMLRAAEAHGATLRLGKVTGIR